MPRLVFFFIKKPWTVKLLCEPQMSIRNTPQICFYSTLHFAHGTFSSFCCCFFFFRKFKKNPSQDFPVVTKINKLSFVHWNSLVSFFMVFLQNNFLDTASVSPVWCFSTAPYSVLPSLVSLTSLVGVFKLKYVLSVGRVLIPCLCLSFCSPDKWHRFG